MFALGASSCKFFLFLCDSICKFIVLCCRLAPLAALALLSRDLLVAKCSGRGLYPDSAWALQRGCSGGVFHHLTSLLLVPHHGQQPGKSSHELQILQKQHSTSAQSLLTWEDAVDWIWGFPACKTTNCWDAQFCWQLMINNHLSWFNVPSKRFLEMFLEQQISC